MRSSTSVSRVRLPVVGALAMAVFGSLWPRDAAAQNATSLDDHRWRSAVASGASFFWGAEGNTVGLALETGLLRRVRNSPLSLRGDLMMHYYGTRSVAPCQVSVNQTCFPLMQRAIFGAALGVQYTLKSVSQNSTARPYLLGGLATYVSSRVASRPPSCTLGEACPNVTLKHDVTDTDFGAQLGVGTTWSVGKREFYLESKYHHRIVRDHQSDPLTMFRFSPIVIGMRF
jgi:hypothetical protein